MSDCSNWRGDRIKATVEREFGERRSGDSGAWSVTRETEWRLGRMVCDERDSQNERRE